VNYMFNDLGALFRKNPVITTMLSTSFLILGLILFIFTVRVWDYTYPVVPMNGAMLPIFIEDKVIKVALDVDRKRDCLASSTITLNRIHEYPPPYGEREDMAGLSLFNTALTQVGEHKIMLWFPVPAFIPPGEEWYVSFHTQDDCGGPFTGSPRPSRPPLVRRLTITKDEIP
jgi:hypothetical protein